MTVPTDTLRVAVWQTASIPSDVAANLLALDRAAAQARAAGAELLITPEMQLTGYNIGEDIARLATHRPLERAADVARRHRIAVLATGPEPLNDSMPFEVANAAWLYDDQGAVLARHRKIQLFGALDRQHFVAGTAPVTLAEYRGVRIAILICFDVEYPEAVRAAALKGAQLVAVPTAQMSPYEFVNEHVIRVRAWENGVYVAYANQIGPDGEFDYVGRSVVADPLGRHLAQAPADVEDLLVFDLDTRTIDEARVQNTHLLEVRSSLFAGEP